jgi:hypothetical protein
MSAPSLRWEELQSNTGAFCYRAPVPGGWLVQLWQEVVRPDGGDVARVSSAVAVTFMPDPEHRWATETNGDSRPSSAQNASPCPSAGVDCFVCADEAAAEGRS